MISVIIPIYNEFNIIDDFIDRLQVFDDDFECIFSVSGNDGTYNKIKKRGLFAIKSEKGRGNQIVNGINKAKGDIIMVLHSDSYFKENPKKEILDILSNYNIGCFSIEFLPKTLISRIIAFNSNNRVIFRNIAFGDQTMFFKRSLYKKLNGFKRIDLMEDYDFSIRVKKSGEKIKLSKMKVYSSFRRFYKNGILKTILMMQKCQYMYRKGASIDDIKREYK